MLKDDLKGVAVELINEFGSTGKLKLNDVQPDPITGEGGSSIEEAVNYFREYYKSNELVENLITNGDARLYIVRSKEPKTSYSFVDDNGDNWNILSVTPIEAQGMDILYEIQIRK